jgi:uncharacterized membrane protein
LYNNIAALAVQHHFSNIISALAMQHHFSAGRATSFHRWLYNIIAALFISSACSSLVGQYHRM